MSNTSSPTPLHSPQLEVRLPPLHEGQLLVAGDPARFKVVVCGRQWGKTVLGACMCVAEASRGGDVWWVAPSFPVGELGWRIIDQLCRQIPGTKFEGRPVFRITLPSGGTIQLRSADNPDSLRGATLSGVVFDEAAMAKPEAWPTLRPTLSARQGWAMFISTPKGLNWFHDIFEDAADRDGWERWRFPSVENPHLPGEDIDMARGEMSSLVFSQEYEADFVSYGSGMFQAEWMQHYRTKFVEDQRVFMLGEQAVPLAGCKVFHTVDLAWSMDERADYTVISTWAVTPKKHLLLLDCIRGHFEGPDIVPKLRLAYDKWGGSHIGVEKATRQMGIIQEAERTGLPVRDLKADKDKVARALPATARMERGTVWFPVSAAAAWVSELEDELLAFPAGRHDDFCVAPGTMIAAERGSVPVEHVKVGDHVWTRDGLRPVTASGLTSPAAERIRVELEDGREVIATANHPVWLRGKFQPLGDVRPGDILSVCESIGAKGSWSSSRGPGSTDTPSPMSGRTASTTSPGSTTAWLGSKTSTARSGRPPTVLSPRGTRFTTSTTTLTTTTSPTWSVSSAESIGPTTPPVLRPTPAASIWTRFGRSLRSGIARLRAASGTRSTPSRHGRLANPSRSGASSAARRTTASPSVPTTSSARGAALRPTGERPVSTMRIGSALPAGTASGSIDSRRPELVGRRVVRVSLAAPGPVHNLTVDGAPEFFANGVLVHNCDTLAYACLELIKPGSAYGDGHGLFTV